MLTSLSHNLNEDYLRFSGTPYLGHLPLCMTQFSPQIDWQPTPFNLRSDQLHSGHVYYPFAGVSFGCSSMAS